MVFSQSLARRRHRPSQASVRSTTHLRGNTSKPWAMSDRLMRRVGRRSFTSGLSQNGAGASRLTPLPPSSRSASASSGCRTASLPPRSPPVASWTLKTTAWSNPFAPAALPAFIARTGWSVPVLRIGTLASWWSPLGLLPWHRSDRFPQFHMRARIRLAPPLRRSPSAPYPGVRRTDPRGSRSLWF